MRRALSRLWRILSAPIRLVLWPFRRVRQFLDYEPEETSAGDAFAQTLQTPVVLLDHLDALRGHLMRSLIALAIGTTIGFTFAQRILDWMAEPIGGIEALQAIEVTESVGAFMKVSLLTGFVLAFPYILLELFAFINPGLKRRERVLLLTSIPAATLLFIGGVIFAYFVMLPVALPFLLNFLGIQTVPRPSNYISFTTNLLFWIGVAFTFPLVIFALASVGMVRARQLAQAWRFAVVGIAVMAAAITPTVDPVNMALLMLPMIALYGLSIVLAAFAERARRRRSSDT
ncbi:MAG: twin-arginine translocase subunit TatC [Chloroflexi bacterium]|nr:twin-arginine translocase subunit TatC [Chloroflexota bacterium]